MADEAFHEPASWQTREAQHGVVFLVFLLALAAARLGAMQPIFEALAGGILAYGVAALVFVMWGERTRPKNTPGWAFLVILWLVAVGVVTVATAIAFRAFFLAFLVTLAVALLARHDSGLAPSFLLAGAVWSALFPPGQRFAEGFNAPQLGEADAVWIAISVVLGVTAATLEHERLVRRTGAGTPAVWTVFRLAFVSVWTILILSVREEVQWGRLFVLLGADLRGQAGQMLLIGILALAIAVAAYAFRPSKRPPKA